MSSHVCSFSSQQQPFFTEQYGFTQVDGSLLEILCQLWQNPNEQQAPKLFYTNAFRSHMLFTSKRKAQSLYCWPMKKQPLTDISAIIDKGEEWFLRVLWWVLVRESLTLNGLIKTGSHRVGDMIPSSSSYNSRFNFNFLLEGLRNKCVHRKV